MIENSPVFYPLLLCPHTDSLQEDAQEEFGWELVHGDVFRPPKKGMLFSVVLGCGTQIFIMIFFTLGRFIKQCLSLMNPFEVLNRS